MTTKLLPVHEEFYTFQGEGVHMGAAAYFVRLFGCPLHCGWCDSASTWHPEYIPANIKRDIPENIAERAFLSGAKIVVITGGEPAIHNLAELSAAIFKRGMRRHLETSGAFHIEGCFDWVTVSPKLAKMPLPENLGIVDELKLIVDRVDAIEFWWDKIKKSVEQQHHETGKKPTIWLHPEWSRRDDPMVLAAIVDAVKTHPDRYRAGWQIHKMYRADTLDTNSRSEFVPLGGNPALGY